MLLCDGILGNGMELWGGDGMVVYVGWDNGMVVGLMGNWMERWGIVNEEMEGRDGGMMGWSDGDNDWMMMG